jgi:hypothetical protein
LLVCPAALQAPLPWPAAHSLLQRLPSLPLPAHLLSPLSRLLPSSVAHSAQLLALLLLLAALVPRMRQLQAVVLATACCSFCLLVPPSLLLLLPSWSAAVVSHAAAAAPLTALIGIPLPDYQTVRSAAAAAADEHPAAGAIICTLALLPLLGVALALVKFALRRVRPSLFVLLPVAHSAVLHGIAPLIMSSSSSSRRRTAASLCLAFLTVCPYLFPAAPPPSDMLRIPLLMAVVPPAFLLLPSIVVPAVNIACAVCLFAALRRRSPSPLSPSPAFVALRVCVRRSVFVLSCLFLLLHQGSAARISQPPPNTFLPFAAAAADIAAPVLLLLMAATRPTAAAAVICLRLWLVPALPPLLLAALLPSVAVAGICMLSACSSRSTAAAAAAAACVAWFQWARVLELIAPAAAAAGGFIAGAGQPPRVAVHITGH